MGMAEERASWYFSTSGANIVPVADTFDAAVVPA
jgi:hypothetical protein